MTKKTINLAKIIYIDNLVQKQKYYGIDDHDLGQAKRWIESFEHYLEWIEINHLEYTEDLEESLKEVK